MNLKTVDIADANRKNLKILHKMKNLKYLQVNKREWESGTLEYLIRRIYSGIFYYRIYRRLYAEHPFYTPGAIRELRNRLDEETRMFEWGSGVSTCWFAGHVLELVAIEHDSDWFAKVSATLRAKSYTNTKCVYVAPLKRDFFKNFSWISDWQYYPTLGRKPEQPQFLEYMSVIDQYENEYFDCIAIDGRERLGCLLHAMPKLKKGGTLILDDSHRPRYDEAFKFLRDWKINRFNFGLFQTTIFTKP